MLQPVLQLRDAHPHLWAFVVKSFFWVQLCLRRPPSFLPKDPLKGLRQGLSPPLLCSTTRGSQEQMGMKPTTVSTHN